MVVILSSAIIIGLLAGLVPFFKNIVGNSLWFEQLKVMGVTIILSLIGTLIIACLVKALVGLRPTEEIELQGLDFNEHGESGYIL